MRSALVLLSVMLFIGCVHAGPAARDAALPGRTQFEILGMLQEYGARFADGKRVEGFYPHEGAVASHFEGLLHDLCSEWRINSNFERTVGRQGHIVFSSRIIAEAIDPKFLGGSLKESVFDEASDEDMLRYVSGAYRRFGDKDRRALFLGANSARKFRTLGSILSRLGCRDVKLYSTKRAMFPTAYVLVFSPSEKVKRRLDVREVTLVSNLPSIGPLLELVEEISPNKAPEPTPMSVTSPAAQEPRQP